MTEEKLKKLLDVLKAQKAGADTRIVYYEEKLKEHPNDTDYIRYRSVALAEFAQFDIIIRMLESDEWLQHVYEIWFQ